MIINLQCASVENHIPRDDIFDYHPIRECNIYILWTKNIFMDQKLYMWTINYLWTKIIFIDLKIYLWTKNIYIVYKNMCCLKRICVV